MHSIVTTFRGAVIKVEVANFCAAMDTLIDQDGFLPDMTVISMFFLFILIYLFDQCLNYLFYFVISSVDM